MGEYPTSKQNDFALWRWTSAIGLAIFSVLVVMSALQTLHGAEAKSMHRAQALEPGSSFLFRFDPASQAFVTIPLALGSVPIGVAVTGTNPTHVWVAEYGTNRVGHLIFTDTAHFQLKEYAVTSTVNSGPYRIALAGNAVWFTERGANRVGRLNAVTGHLDEFYGHGLSPNAGLTDIKIAANGVIWIGGQKSQRLIALVVNSPNIYSFSEYTDTVRPSFTVAPAVLAIEKNDSIWMTVPEADYYRVAQFTPSTGEFVWPTLLAGNLPMGIVATPARAWVTDLTYNAINQIEVGTYTVLNSYGPVTRPMEIAAESSDRFWITQQTSPGSITRFIYTSTVSTRMDSFVLPILDAQITGISVAPDSGVWFAAFVPFRIYLPVAVRGS